MTKGNDQSIKTTTPASKELNADSIKSQLEEKVEYHKKLVAEKERILGELNKVESALAQNMGSINTLQGLQREYFVTDAPSVNGEK
jgi:hypothetical protein